jgi:hypothetical protein
MPIWTGVRGSFLQDLKGLEQAHYCCRGGDIGGGHNWRIARTEVGVLLLAAKDLSFTAKAAVAVAEQQRLGCDRRGRGHE